MTCKEYGIQDTKRNVAEALGPHSIQKCPFCETLSSRAEGTGHCNKMTCWHCHNLWLWVPGATQGKKWVSYDYHDSKKETFDSVEEKKRWESRQNRVYFGNF